MPNGLSGLSTLAAFVAFILSALCLFAGTKTSILVDTDILTLYTPDVGNDLGVSDFYSIYVMSYCEGSLGKTDDGTLYRENFTYCSDRAVPFSFDPFHILLEETGNETSLSSMGWPSAISGDFRAFSITSQAMAVFYCIGAGVAGFMIIIKLFSCILRSSRQSIIEASFLLLGFISLSISSIIATVYAFQFVALVNYHGEEANVTAGYGQKFLIMSWVAAGLLLLGSIISLSIVVADHRRAEPGPALSHYDPKVGMEEENMTIRSRV
ncbi:hypothetical protein ASPWEDRAFT_31051 [Aspergillus wentii DTO 134E9]|uniref:Uncharacterized protein n=1 Tax=Aspergillus wentii DTO 134E9 TaxID=1073089 RepID=A0A1L9RB17_ASPWE|nr:uncharacterized protein ASPWEDRAFT_31051 [Aspergillus wentii DTO 134E9]OJJ32115.1 hypothetical protein ASPWEDRAFT_31051 [Aspergillus wentii DTO 134E9]